MGKILNIASIFAAGVLVQACNTSGCTENQNSLPLAGFYSMETRQQISIDSLGIGGVGRDSLFYGPPDRLSQAYLPFRSQFDETAYYFRYMQKTLDFPEIVDTVRFTYTSQPYFASEECGAMYRYTIRKVDYTTHLIDSVGIVDSVITNSEMERIRIYFHTSLPDDEETYSTPGKEAKP